MIHVQVHQRTVISKNNILESWGIPEYDPEGVKVEMQSTQKYNTTICDYCHEGSSQTDYAFETCKYDCQTIAGYSDNIAMAILYCMLKPGSWKINICLWNHRTTEINLLRKTAVGEISAATVLLALLVPKLEENDIKGGWS